MAELSLCMIVRDEADRISRLLPAIVDTVDQVVIVDTGSADSTKDVAAPFADCWIEQPWEKDFSAARNVALEAATGDWILVLDADEIIEPDDVTRLRTLIDQAPSGTYGYIFETRNYTDDHGRYDWRPLDEGESDQHGTRGYLPSQVVRLFRNDPRLRYRGRVHELIEPSIADAGGEIEECGITLHHALTERDDGDGRSKRERYHELLELKVTDEPDSAKAHWELAQSQLGKSQLSEAQAMLERAWELAPGNLEIGLSLGGLLNSTQKSLHALPILRQVRDGASPDPRVEFQVGLALYGLGKLEEAREAFYSAHLRGAKFPQVLYWLALLTSKEPATALGFLAQLDKSAPEFWPGQILAAHLHVQQDDAASALECLYCALAHGDGSNRYLHELGDFLRLLGSNDAAQKVWAEIESHDELRRLAAAALERAGDRVRAADLRGEPVDPLEPIRVQIESGQFGEARTALEAWTADEDHRAEAQYLLARIDIGESKWSDAADKLTSCLEFDGGHVRALTDLAGLHGNSGRLNLARKLLEHAVVLAPDDALAHHNLAVAAILDDPPDAELAQHHLERARALGHPEDPELSRKLGAMTTA